MSTDPILARLDDMERRMVSDEVYDALRAVLDHIAAYPDQLQEHDIRRVIAESLGVQP